MKNVVKLLAQASEGRMAAQVFASFARVSATALGCGMREEEYLEEAKRLTAKDLTLFADALAHLVEAMESRKTKGWQTTGSSKPTRNGLRRHDESTTNQHSTKWSANSPLLPA